VSFSGIAVARRGKAQHYTDPEEESSGPQPGLKFGGRVKYISVGALSPNPIRGYGPGQHRVTRCGTTKPS